ncbi:MAG: SDR family oxidoreductase [Beijerinckiaceae bacterium]|nr:SDR family oxidoreductase [Beijerinckiaceae bacterium]
MSAYLITGANRGIGLQLVRQAAATGETIYAGARKPDEAEALAELAKLSGGRVKIIQLDVGDEASITAAAKALAGEPIGTLINNAGIMGSRNTALQMDPAEFMDIMRVNVLGPVLVTRAFLPNLRAAPGAKVAVVSSLMGSFSYETTSYIAYSTSKTAVNRMFNSLARELAGDGIGVAILSPGWVRTDMGGPNATLSVEESARGLLREIARTDASLSGKFRDYAGAKITW